MKILQVIQFFSPLFGGSPVVPYNLSKTLTKRGHNVTIFTSDYKVGQEWINSSPNIKVFPFKTRLNLKKLLITPSMLKFAKEGLKEFDVIHMHNYRTFQNIVVHHYAKKYGVPYVLQAHGSLPRSMTKQKLKWIYDMVFGYRVLKNASKVIAVSQIEVEQYMDMGVPYEKIAIIPNGIDLYEYSNLPPRGYFRKKFDIEDNEKIVLYLGRIHRIKGIDILIDAFENIVKKLNNIRLVIVGPDDGYLDKIKHLIETKNLKNNILLTGPLYGNDKIEAYIDSDVYVLPSRYEIWGMTILEAYACGIPVIASKVGGLKELVLDEVTGLLFTPENIGQLVKSLLFILDDNIRAEKIGEKGNQFAKENFTIEKVVDRLEVLYKEIATISRSTSNQELN